MNTKKLLTISKKARQEKEQQTEKEHVEKHEYRQAVLRKIEEFEKEGKFDVDVEDDPPTIVLTPENIDYLREKRKLEVKGKISKVPVLISVISVLFFIPLLLMIILGPILLDYIG